MGTTNIPKSFYKADATLPPASYGPGQCPETSVSVTTTVKNGVTTITIVVNPDA